MMSKPIADVRKTYDRDTLDEARLPDDPVVQFTTWLEDALTGDPLEANAMVLSTVAAGRPRGRYVLLKAVDERGFVFYTNGQSEKGAELEATPFAALTFYWRDFERQVRIEGRIERISGEESDAYFASRPRASQIGACASPQSQPISDREELELREAAVKAEFDGRAITRPPHWGGFRVVPDRVEFWQGRPSRLHDRLCYSLNDGGWSTMRLAP
ncbi:MAG: pyridoxamine 5'-phosphate oxidase [Bradymonadia bacterium]|jgi:pyridoxamine 5'-phosphate oxidase